MKFKNIFIFPLLLSLNTLANAAPPSVKAITSSIIKIASKYAEAVSCGEHKIGPNDIAALAAWKPGTDFTEVEYLVFWNADMGCTGGTAFFGIQVASIKVDQFGHFYVDALESSPNKSISGGALLGYGKVIGASKGTVTIEASCGLRYNMIEVPKICDEQESFNLNLQKQRDEHESCSQDEMWVPTGKTATLLGF